jgi:hypothetical protein
MPEPAGGAMRRPCVAMKIPAEFMAAPYSIPPRAGNMTLVKQ